MHNAVCQCRALSVSSDVDPDFVVACNCVACQRRTGSPFGVGAYFKQVDLRIGGAQKTWSRSSDSGRGLVNHFCENCGTNVYWTLEMRPDHIGVAAGCFTAPLPEPARVIWTEAKHDWVVFPDHLPEFPKATP